MSFSHAKNIGLTQAEENQLRALVYHAYDLRGTPEAAKACQDIVDWYQIRTARNVERPQPRPGPQGVKR